ncbi:MAG: hypothetical protein H6555_05095 [Lewinellaceae bacterium]|nr:hypothetical protein [Lewinellaceae bacterium]
MDPKRIIVYAILFAAVVGGARKVMPLLDTISTNLVSLIGMFLVVGLLALAVARVLRS